MQAVSLAASTGGIEDAIFGLVIWNYAGPSRVVSKMRYLV